MFTQADPIFRGIKLHPKLKSVPLFCSKSSEQNDSSLNQDSEFLRTSKRKAVVCIKLNWQLKSQRFHNQVFIQRKGVRMHEKKNPRKHLIPKLH